MNCCGCVLHAGLTKGTPPVVLNENTITDLVANAGGNVNAFFRASLAWNSWSDLDLHLQEKMSGGEHIYYGYKKSDKTKGTLDVDMNVGSEAQQENSRTKSKPAVENIMYSMDTSTNMIDGEYDIGFAQYGVNGDREEGADTPYFMLEHRLPSEERLSHFALFKYRGANLPTNTSHVEHLISVEKQGNEFWITNYDCSKIKLISIKDFKIKGDGCTGWTDVGANLIGSGTANAAESGENPVDTTPAASSGEDVVTWVDKFRDFTEEDEFNTYNKKERWELKVVNGQETEEKRNVRTELVSTVPKERWVNETTQSNRVVGSYRIYEETTCEWKYLGETKDETNTSRNCTTREVRRERINTGGSRSAHRCTFNTPQYCHHDSDGDRS